MLAGMDAQALVVKVGAAAITSGRFVLPAEPEWSDLAVVGSLVPGPPLDSPHWVRLIGANPGSVPAEFDDRSAVGGGYGYPANGVVTQQSSDLNPLMVQQIVCRKVGGSSHPVRRRWVDGGPPRTVVYAGLSTPI
jgi:hypothetical protein